MCVLIFSTAVVRNILNFMTNSARFDQKRTLVFMYSTAVTVTLLWHLDLSTDFRKTIIKHYISWTSVEREPSCSVGQTDMAKLIAALRNFANALENAIFTKNIVLYNSYGFTGNRRQTTRWPNSLVLQYQATIPRTCIHRYACSTCTFN